MFQDDEDGALIISNYIATRKLIEAIRFSYAFNKSIEISGVSSPGTGAKKIQLGDGNEYQQILVALHDHIPFDINTKSCDATEGFSVNHGSLRIGFCDANKAGNRYLYKVEVESKTDNNEFVNLEKYLLCESEENWRVNIDILLNSGGYSLANLNGLPNKAFVEFSNTQRIKLLNKIATAKLDDYYNLAARVMGNVKIGDIASFFEEVNNNALFSTFHELMDDNFYAVFIRASLLTYYEREDIEVKISEIEDNDRVFVWHRGIGSNGLGDRVDYLTSIESKQVIIKGKVVKWINKGTPEMLILDRIGPIELYNETLSATEMVGVYMDEGKLCNLNATKEVLPMPAFYFDWLIECQAEEDLYNAFDATLTIVSFGLGIGELLAASSTIRTTVAIISLARTTGNLCFGSPVIKSKLELILGIDNPMILNWDKISVVLSSVTVGYSVINESSVLFGLFSDAWSQARNNEVVWAKIQQQLSDEEIAAIYRFTNVINY